MIIEASHSSPGPRVPVTPAVQPSKKVHPVGLMSHLHQSGSQPHSSMALHVPSAVAGVHTNSSSVSVSLEPSSSPHAAIARMTAGATMRTLRSLGIAVPPWVVPVSTVT